MKTLILILFSTFFTSIITIAQTSELYRKDFDEVSKAYINNLIPYVNKYVVAQHEPAKKMLRKAN